MKLIEIEHKEIDFFYIGQIIPSVYSGNPNYKVIEIDKIKESVKLQMQDGTFPSHWQPIKYLVKTKN